MNPALIGLLVLIGYSLFLSFKNILYFYKNGEKRMAMIGSLFLLITPFLVYGAALIPNYSNLRLWVGAPAICLGSFWALSGFFMDSYVKKEQRIGRENMAARNAKMKAPVDWQKKAWLILLFSLILWSYGAFIGVENKTVSTLLLCLSMFLFGSAISSFWKWRKF